jgi:peptidoglycan/LPS O-acetylase OafA/YrhL
VVALYLPEHTSYPSLLLIVPITLAIAYASWHLIEDPSMRIAQKLARGYELRPLQP